MFENHEFGIKRLEWLVTNAVTDAVTDAVTIKYSEKQISRNVGHTAIGTSGQVCWIAAVGCDEAEQGIHWNSTWIRRIRQYGPGRCHGIVINLNNQWIIISGAVLN